MFSLFPLLFLLLLTYYACAEDCGELGCFDQDRASSLVLISQNFPDAFCSGTIVSPAYVLTAAHCSSKKTLHVYPGLAFEYIATLKEEQANGSKVVRQHLHPKYDRKTLANDIAVFEVSPKISLDSTSTGVVFQALLPSSAIGGEPHQWEDCAKDSYIMGWTNSIVNTTSAVTMCTRTPIMPLDDCQSRYKAVDLKNRICVRQKDQICINAGGAVMCNGMQVGVISYVHCEIETLPCRETQKRSLVGTVKTATLLVKLGVFADSGVKTINRLNTYGHAYTLEWVESEIERLTRKCKWFKWLKPISCLRLKNYKIIRTILEEYRAEAQAPLSNPYVSVRTDTALDFIKDVVDGRATAESFYRLDISLLIFCTLPVIIMAK